MNDKIKLDNLDNRILSILQSDARRSFQEISRELDVSGGTIHVRINRLKELGVIKGSKIILDYQNLGYDMVAFIGINLHNARDYNRVLSKLDSMEEIVEAYYTTGSYSLFIKVVLPSASDLKIFLVDKLQTIEEIQSTETLVSLDEPILRDIRLSV